MIEMPYKLKSDRAAQQKRYRKIIRTAKICIDCFGDYVVIKFARCPDCRAIRNQKQKEYVKRKKSNGLGQSQTTSEN